MTPSDAASAAAPMSPVAPSRQAPVSIAGAGGSGSIASGGPPSATPTTLPIRTACSPSALTMTITPSASGSNASFAVTLTSRAARTCTVTEEAQTPSITVSGAGGGTVWTAGCDHSVSGHAGALPCPAYALVKDLAPGATQRWTQDWDGTADAAADARVAPAPPGPYTVHAAVGGAQASAPFTLG